MLVKAELLDGQRGKTGGYRLVKPASEIMVGDILKLTEESLAPVSCLDCQENQCAKAADCKTLPMWKKLDSLIQGYLFSISIEDLNSGKVDI